MSTTVTNVTDRELWLAERRNAIGASEVAAVLGLSKWATPWEIWAEKTGRIDPWSGSKATQAGQLLENAVLDYASDALSSPLKRQVRVVADGIPLAATCDAITHSGQPVEAKTTGIVGPIYGEWGDELTDEVPDQYLIQVHAQIICTKAELGYLFALIPGRGIVQYQFIRNDRMVDTLRERLTDWWDTHIVRGLEPPKTPMPQLDVIKRLRKEAGKVIQASPQLVALLEHREQAKAKLASIAKEVEEVEAELLMELGDAEVAELPDGRRLTYLQSERKGYTVEPCKYRTLRTTKAKK